MSTLVLLRYFSSYLGRSKYLPCLTMSLKTLISKCEYGILLTILIKKSENLP